MTREPVRCPRCEGAGDAIPQLPHALGCPDAAPVHRINIDGGLRIGSDGSYSSEYQLPLIHAKLADELVRMEHRRNVILAFRSAHDFPKGSRSS